LQRRTRQLNFRIPEELSDDLKDLCWDRGWKIDLTMIEFLTLGLLVAKNLAIHNQLNEIFDRAEIVNVSRPDYVQLAIKQYKDIENQEELKQIETQESLTNLSIPLKAVQMFRQKEIEV